MQSMFAEIGHGTSRLDLYDENRKTIKECVVRLKDNERKVGVVEIYDRMDPSSVINVEG